MFVFDTAALLTARGEPRAKAPARGLRQLPARLLAAAVAHRDLAARGRALPRPARCGWLPRRAWRRHGALICLRAGIDPDAAPEDVIPEDVTPEDVMPAHVIPADVAPEDAHQ